MPVTSSRSSLKRWPKPEVVRRDGSPRPELLGADVAALPVPVDVLHYTETEFARVLWSRAVIRTLRPARMAHMCYDWRMTTVASRELRNRTRQLLERVEAGEDVTITVDGRPVARLTRVSEKPRWIHRDALLAMLAEVSADPGLRDELDALLTEQVDDREIG